MRHLRFAGGLALLALLLYRPQAAALGAANAMRLWYGSVAPALFPFLALMPLLTCDEAARAYEKLFGRAMGALFGLPGAAAPAMVIGMVAGSPAGAIAARDAAARSGMSRGQLHRLAVAAAGFSPAFLVGGVGAGMLGSAAAGWRLLAAQLATQLTMAALLRRAWRERTGPVIPPEGGGGEAPMRAAVLTALGICGYMALFGALTFALRACVGPGIADPLLCVLDVPSAARLVADAPLADGARQALLAAMCGFGGLCVAAQNLGALKGCGLRAGEYLGLRTLAGAMAAGFSLLLRGWPGARAAFPGGRIGPLAAAALCAALLAAPVLPRLRKSVF